MTPSDRELLRIELLRLLAVHPDVEFRMPVLLGRLAQRVPHVTFDETDVAEALFFFEGLAIVARIRSELDGPPRWRITQQGKLFHERNP